MTCRGVICTRRDKWYRTTEIEQPWQDSHYRTAGTAISPQDTTDRTGRRSGRSVQGREERMARKWQLRQDNRDRTTVVVKPGETSRGRIVRTGKRKSAWTGKTGQTERTERPEHDSKDMTARTGQPGQERWQSEPERRDIRAGKSARIGQLGQDSQERTAEEDSRYRTTIARQTWLERDERTNQKQVRTVITRQPKKPPGQDCRDSSVWTGQPGQNREARMAYILLVHCPFLTVTALLRLLVTGISNVMKYRYCYYKATS
jgi:hypothetical protein